MPRKDAVEERTEQRLADAKAKRSAAATKGAQTRRQRREAAAGGDGPATAAESPAQPQQAPQKGKRGGARPPKDPSAVTIAFRGEVAGKLRALAQSGNMSLAHVVQEAVLVLEAQISAGYELGTALQQHRQAAKPE